MFPGTNFQPPHYYYEVGATTTPESSGGVSNYGAMSPTISGITKFHWREDYVDDSSWTASSFPGWESPDGYGGDGYAGWAKNCLSNKIAKDLGLGNGTKLTGAAIGTYVIKIPEDVAMGAKEVDYIAGTGYWKPGPAIYTGSFPLGSTVIIHNYGIIAGGGAAGGRGGGIYNVSTVNKDAIGGGGGGGSGLHDWDLPFNVHEQGDNFLVYPLDVNKTSGGPNPDVVFPGSGGTPTLRLTVFAGHSAANGAFGFGNLAPSSSAAGGTGYFEPTGITHVGIPALASVTATNGGSGGQAFRTIGQLQTYWIYNHSTGKIYGGAGAGGGAGAVGAGTGEGGDGGDGGPPGEAGTAGETVGAAAGGSAGTAGRVFAHDGFWDAADANQSKYILKQNDGTIKGIEGDNSAFDAGTEY